MSNAIPASPIGALEARSSSCNAHKAKVGLYATTVTLVALAVILGALIVVTQHYGLHLGPLKGPMQQVTEFLGQYTLIPLAASGGLLMALVVVGIIWKCSDPAPRARVETRLDQPSSVTLGKPYPTAARAPLPQAGANVVSGSPASGSGHIDGVRPPPAAVKATTSRSTRRVDNSNHDGLLDPSVLTGGF
ncbi:hypothetical protein ACFLR2_02200 [Chlamydiota bacterium]